MIDITTAPETGKEKPTVPQPTSGSTPLSLRAALRIEDPQACDLCGSVDPSHASMTCWQRRIDTARELGVIPPTPPPTRRPALQTEEIMQEENEPPSPDAPLIGESPPALINELQIIDTPSLPPYDEEAHCVWCQLEMGSFGVIQFKCSTCHDCFVCEPCMEDMIERWDPG